MRHCRAERSGRSSHFGDELNNFSETAALISNLDLVISVDTSVAHLAGALGKPVWISCHMSPTGDGYSIGKTVRGIRRPAYFGKSHPHLG